MEHQRPPLPRDPRADFAMSVPGKAPAASEPRPRPLRLQNTSGAAQRRLAKRIPLLGCFLLAKSCLSFSGLILGKPMSWQKVEVLTSLCKMRQRLGWELSATFRVFAQRPWDEWTFQWTCFGAAPSFKPSWNKRLSQQESCLPTLACQLSVLLKGPNGIT